MQSIEERVANLEKVVAQLRSRPSRQKDWTKTVGRFRNDPVMDAVIDGALQAREEEREQNQRQAQDEQG